MKNLRRAIFAGLFFVLVARWTLPAAMETYVADSAHSSVNFSIRNVVVRVTGRFKAFKATLGLDSENPERNSVMAEIDVASIDTGERKRDEHLQQPEFFDAAKHPRISFQSTAWRKIATNEFEVSGNLTIRGTSRPVVLRVKSVSAASGSKREPDFSRWEATAKINRHDFGVSANSRVIGAEVDIIIKIAAEKKS